MGTTTGMTTTTTATAANNDIAPPPPPPPPRPASPHSLRVCVIGGGPAAMFFCHAYDVVARHGNGGSSPSPSSPTPSSTPSSSTASSTSTMHPLRELEIMCFEMKSTPCGVWRMPPPTESGIDGDDDDTVEDVVYDELWTNAVAHCYEYFDHGFDEHFGDGMKPTIFLPRRDVNEYLIKRVTKHNENFFDDYFAFNTRVVNVRDIATNTTEGETCSGGGEGDYANGGGDERRGGFHVTLHSIPTNRTYTRIFDACIWAGGENRIGSMPKSLLEIFEDHAVFFGGERWKCSSTNDVDGGGLGTLGDTTIKRGEDATMEEDGKGTTKRIAIFHSADTHMIREQCCDRNVLLIGGGLSAEDMALQCLKWGANRVDISTRADKWSAVSSTTMWPGDKVRIHLYTEVRSVDEDGTILLGYVTPNWPCGYVPYSSDDDDEGEEGVITLEGIRTVILCTGYVADIDMLDPSLRPECGLIPRYNMGDHPSLYVTDVDWSDWKMKTKDNHAIMLTGHVAPGRKRMIRKNYNHPDMHRGILFKNPNMMYLCEHGSDIPLLSLDVHAWLLCSYLTRRVPMPTVDVLRIANRRQYMDQMHLPIIRYECDEAYHEILYNIAGYWDESDESSSSEEDDSDSDDDDNGQEEEEGGEEKEKGKSPSALDEIEYEKYQLRLLCRVMEEGKYPGICLGDYNSLNEHGNSIIKYGDLSTETRSHLKADHAEDSEWRTFRDADEQARSVVSLYPGTRARQLGRRWMDIKEGRLTTIRNGGA